MFRWTKVSTNPEDEEEGDGILRTTIATTPTTATTTSSSSSTTTKRRRMLMGITKLSRPTGLEEENPDGRIMRRRMALYMAICLLLISVSIALLILQGRKDNGHDDHGAYLHITSTYVESQASQVDIWKHHTSGMEVLTMVPTDTSNDAVFGMNFRILPTDDKGTAHIVEHAVMDGSVNYPVKDPFNQLEQGSLRTYLDSWTFKDRTAFVVATRNKVDLNNSMSILLDAVFQPKMALPENSWIFRQEAWRIEVENNERVFLNGYVGDIGFCFLFCVCVCVCVTSTISYRCFVVLMFLPLNGRCCLLLLF